MDISEDRVDAYNIFERTCLNEHERNATKEGSCDCLWVGEGGAGTFDVSGTYEMKR